MVSSCISLGGQRQGQSGVKCYEGAFCISFRSQTGLENNILTSFQDASNIATAMRRVQGTFSM